MKLGTCVSFSSMEGMEEKLQQLRRFGFSSCQLISWNPKVWTEENAAVLKELLAKYDVTVSAFWCGWEGPSDWNFYEGQLTLGLVPVEYRYARVKNLCDGADFAKKLGITVCNVPCYGTSAVAQFTIALLLELCHHVGRHDVLVHQGAWTSCQDFCLWTTPQMELAGKTLGIIGYGRIGQAVGIIAKALGMEVIAFNRSPKADVENVSLEELLRRSDVISLHCPLFPETANIISRENLAKMKDGAMLINTARGALIDEQAVADALASGKLRGAAVDVATVEPMRKDNPLLSAPNCLITPHMAWAPLESRRRLLNTVADNVRCYVEGKPQNVVNK